MVILIRIIISTSHNPYYIYISYTKNESLDKSESCNIDTLQISQFIFIFDTK